MAQTAEVERATLETEAAVGIGYSDPPPLFGGTLILGLLLNRALPIPFLPGRTGRLAGVALALAGLLLGRAAIGEMRRAGTTPRPSEPTRALVTTGPYRYTRNPIYLAMSLAYAGVATSANALWPLLFLPGVLLALSRGMIPREERYLERRFGESYRRYRSQVRRWI